jgi:hypothetical protein
MMEEGERERWFIERENQMHQRANETRRTSETESNAQRVEEGKRAQVAEQYGIDEDEYIHATKLVHQFLEKADPKFDGKVTTDQVVFAHRQMMALDVIGKTVPHLEEHAQFDNIVGDIVRDLVHHPAITREKLAKQLLEVFGQDDKKGLRNLSKKATKNAESDDETPEPKKTKKDFLTFEDVD